MAPGLILTFNAGSSTIKLGLYETLADAPRLLARGSIDFRDEPFEIRMKLEGRSLAQALTAEPDDLIGMLRESFDWIGGFFDLASLEAIGHRVVHGGDAFSGPARINAEVLAQIEALAALAPLHQPQSLRLIRAVSALYPDVPQVASFDTAFHATMDPLARRFAIPRTLHDQGIKRYGFHGLSYAYVAQELERLDLPPAARVVAAHLGSGASLCAMRGGVSCDTSMGFSTIDGIPMATRSGTLDPGVILHLMGPMGRTLGQVEQMLYHESGLLGVSGFEADSRELMESDRPEAAEAIDLFCLRIAGETARLAVTLGGLDALVFTAGIGEHQPAIRARVADHLGWLGLYLDPEANAGNDLRITGEGSAIQVFIIPTDEEKIIASETMNLLATLACGPKNQGRS